MVFAGHLLDWATDQNIDLSESVRSQIENGFGSGLNGDDLFDALIGLYGMINVILGNHPIVEPHSALISNIEGWIFGQDIPSEGN